MKKLIAATLLLFGTTLQVTAQTLKGRVLDAQSNNPVGFVSIGVLHRDAGTVTNEAGNFALNPLNAAPTDTLKISMLGYESQMFQLQQFATLLTRQNGQIKLMPKTWNLKEVVIKPRQTKIITAGNTTDTKFMRAGFSTNDLGSEVGTVIKYKKKTPGKIENVNFNLAENSYETLLFRVNLYEFKDEKVGENLLKEPLYLETMVQSGTLTLDLSEKEIYITQDCLLTLEWIKDYGKRGLMFSAGFFNADSYARKISQGDWFKAPAGLGFWATIVHEK